MIDELIQDFKSGPLDVYRNKTSFDWKKLKVFIETEHIIKYQNELYQVLESNGLYDTEDFTTKSIDEQRRITFQTACELDKVKMIKWDELFVNFKRPSAFIRILTTASTSAYIKQGVGNGMLTYSMMLMGTERHHHYIEDALNGKILGCYCLTEIGHGSNTRGLRTTATYDKHKKVFILNSPDFEAAKCWAGGLGQAAMYGTVYAQLLIDGTHYGLHAFVVPLRDPKTLKPYPGIEIGDMGAKIGINGVDNGFVQFNHYEIPRVNLLNKIADVTEDGRYVTRITDPNKRHGAALGFLSSGRVGIACMSESLGTKALTIAIRYAAVRKQFGPDGKEEVPILEYQSHQLRLLPYLAAAYVLKIFNTYFSETFYEFLSNGMNGNAGPDAPETGMEIHAVSSVSKAMSGWIMKEAIQECREACGGHGYLQASGIGDVRNENDPTLTYEGENHVLIQQTINWLLKLAPQMINGRKIFSPLQSVDFLTNGSNILKNSRFNAKHVDDVCNPEDIMKTYEWLVTFLLKATHDKIEEEVKFGKDLFTAKNNSQVFYGKSLAIAFFHYFSLKIMLVTISQADDPAIRTVLTKLFSLYGLWAIDKWHIATLYKGGYASNTLLPVLIHDAILKLCADLKDDAVALVDVIAVPDFILRSALGASDGEVYKHLHESMTKDAYNMNRPTWWKDIVNFSQNKNTSKL